jgi:hypothetical protein
MNNIVLVGVIHVTPGVWQPILELAEVFDLWDMNMVNLWRQYVFETTFRVRRRRPVGVVSLVLQFVFSVVRFQYCTIFLIRCDLS